MSECVKCNRPLHIKEIKFYLGQHLCSACFDEKQRQIDPDGYWARRRKQHEEAEEDLAFEDDEEAGHR